MAPTKKYVVLRSTQWHRLASLKIFGTATTLINSISKELIPRDPISSYITITVTQPHPALLSPCRKAWLPRPLSSWCLDWQVHVWEARHMNVRCKKPSGDGEINVRWGSSLRLAHRFNTPLSHVRTAKGQKAHSVDCFNHYRALNREELCFSFSHNPGWAFIDPHIPVS